MNMNSAIDDERSIRECEPGDYETGLTASARDVTNACALRVSELLAETNS